MSVFAETVWMELLCSEQSAALRHVPLVWDRGWLPGGRSRSQPVHSPAPDTRFHGKTKVLLLHSVPSRQHLIMHLWAAHLSFGSHVRLRFPEQQQQTSGGRGAWGPRKRLSVLRGTDKSWGLQCLDEGGEDSPLSPPWAAVLARSLSLPVAPPEWDWTGEVSADRLWKRSRLQCWDTWWEQRGAGLPESSASAVESRLSAGASLSGGLH